MKAPDHVPHPPTLLLQYVLGQAGQGRRAGGARPLLIPFACVLGPLPTICLRSTLALICIHPRKLSLYATWLLPTNLPHGAGYLLAQPNVQQLLKVPRRAP